MGRKKLKKHQGLIDMDRAVVVAGALDVDLAAEITPGHEHRGSACRLTRYDCCYMRRP